MSRNHADIGQAQLGARAAGSVRGPWPPLLVVRQGGSPRSAPRQAAGRGRVERPGEPRGALPRLPYRGAPAEAERTRASMADVMVGEMR